MPLVENSVVFLIGREFGFFYLLLVVLGYLNSRFDSLAGSSMSHPIEASGFGVLMDTWRFSCNKFVNHILG